jgi:hypothetical protein
VQLRESTPAANGRTLASVLREKVVLQA